MLLPARATPSSAYLACLPAHAQVRATHGTHEGAWYYEATVEALPPGAWRGTALQPPHPAGDVRRAVAPRVLSAVPVLPAALVVPKVARPG